MLSHKTHSPIHEDSFGIHVWSQQLQRCRVVGAEVHSHHMRCAWCGLQRHGAFAEQGAYHYFTYDHPEVSVVGAIEAGMVPRLSPLSRPPMFIHGLLPPCNRTRKPPSGVEILEIEICARCFHYIHFYDQSAECKYGCRAATIKLVGCFRRKTEKT